MLKEEIAKRQIAEAQPLPEYRLHVARAGQHELVTLYARMIARTEALVPTFVPLTCPTINRSAG